MANYRSGLLTPPREEEERKIYRPVWRSLILENGILAGVMVVLFVLQGIFGFAFPARLLLPLNVLLALLPAILWFALSVLPERAYPMPRQRLTAVFVVAALVARSIGEPFITDILQTHHWLPLSSALNRIIGYAFTVGIVECGLCYVVVRAVIWPNHLRERFDVVAYGATVAIGYTITSNIEFALAGNAPAYVVAMNTFATVSALTAVMLLTGYGMAGTRFDGAGVFFQPAMLALSALVMGVALPLRAGFLNAGFSVLGVVLPRYLFGIGFSIGLFAAGIFVITFLLRFADRQAKEREEGDGF